MTDAVTPPATTIELPLTPSANFASICAQLLELMSAGAPGSRLAGFLQRAIALLRKGEIALVSDNGIVRTNDTDLAARTAHTWHTVMTQHGVKRVTFAADATTRELLQFLALLVASPSTPSRSFTDLWRELGAWRIHAQVAADGSEASLATPTNAQPPLVDDDDAFFAVN